ncbi:hypothetical protein V8J82_16095 [Gymnodinialimonas sp. 2305UL16-5]|uniref:hypothetical protein n=1 Tax=Gymnodinialimonas mytili TaxID=3126503 RepID=UPI0030AA22FE
MLSIQAKIILGFFAFILVGSGLAIWFVLAIGNGLIAILAPLAVGGLVTAASFVALRNRDAGPSE